MSIPDRNDTPCCAVVELRQYTLHPGQRDVLIDLFDAEFVDTQEALGISVLGQFRDLDDPDRFVWLRGFPDMDARLQSLQSFYSGPVWQAHRNAANATMIDSDNVLLLRPADADAGFTMGARSASSSRGEVAATIHYLDADGVAGFAAHFESSVAPRLAAAGIDVLARFVTEDAVNTFPRLPVRTDETVFIWFARHDDDARSVDDLLRELRQRAARTEVLRLAPTSKSMLPLPRGVR